MVFRIYSNSGPVAGRLLLLHSAAKGVQFLPLSEYVANYDGELAISRHPKLDNERADAMLGFGYAQLGRRYDVHELLKIGARWIAQWGRLTRFYLTLRGIEKPEQNSALICSELVADCLRAGGCEVTHGDLGVLPVDVERSTAILAFIEREPSKSLR